MKQSSLPFSSIFADEMRQYLELAESADKVIKKKFYQLTFSMHGLIRLIPVQGAEPVKPVVYGNLHDILMR